MTADNNEVIINGVYKHYKGNLYRVIGIGVHSESLEKLVIYRAVDDTNKIWVRPLNMWNEEIEKDGKIVKRFEFIMEFPDKTLIL